MYARCPVEWSFFSGETCVDREWPPVYLLQESYDVTGGCMPKLSNHNTRKPFASFVNSGAFNFSLI